jgi:hypothetical protein
MRCSEMLYYLHEHCEHYAKGGGGRLFSGVVGNAALSKPASRKVRGIWTIRVMFSMSLRA